MKINRYSLLLLSLFVSGCSTVNKYTKAEPAAAAGFLPAPELLSEMRDRYPFHGAWMNMHLQSFQEYKRIYINPIDTSHLTENDWWEQATLNGNDLSQDAKDFAVEAEEIFRQVFTSGMRLAVTDKPEENSLILELSVVELVPAKVWLSSLGLLALAAPVSIGVPVGAGAALGQNGTVAIEGILRDGQSGEILLMFADREASKIRIVDFTTLTWYRHAYEIMEDWSDQLMELLITPHDHMVPDSDGFAWAPF